MAEGCFSLLSAGSVSLILLAVTAVASLLKKNQK